MSVLDDDRKIKQIDRSNALEVAAAQSEQLTYDKFKIKPPAIKRIDNIVVVGMGGSALAALICRDWWDDQLSVPFVVTRDYTLPAFVGTNTLVIASSYSGNTEETVSALHDAQKRGAAVVCMTSGGELAEVAAESDFSLIRLPSGYQPRMAVWVGVRALATLFEKLGLISGAVDALSNVQPRLAAAVDKLLPAVPVRDNRAKQVAEQLLNKTVIVYSGPLLAAAAYKWKINCNENAKNLAWNNQLPEFNHNEFIGWSSAPSDKPFAVVELQSDQDHHQIKKRFKVSNRLLVNNIPTPIEIMVPGGSRIEQLLWAIQLGDFTSLYLAILNGQDPTPVELVEQLKKELG